MWTEIPQMSGAILEIWVSMLDSYARFSWSVSFLIA